MSVLIPRSDPKRRLKPQIENALEWDGVNALEHCDHRHSMSLVKAIMECRFSIDTEDKWETEPVIDSRLVSFFEYKKMNGSQLKSYQRDQFEKDVIEFCDGNKEMKEVATALHKRLVVMDHKQMSRFKKKISKIPFLQRVNWRNCIMIFGLPLVALYGLLTVHEFIWQTWIWAILYFFWTELGITAGIVTIHSLSAMYWK